MLTRFDRSPLEVAPGLLGGVLKVGEVSVRLTEVEAYDGSRDPASHSFRGLTARNGAMFGVPGSLYCYVAHGHTMLNLVCRAEGEPAGVLLRAGEVVDGLAVAQRRRGDTVRVEWLARGPGCLGKAVGITLADGGRVLGSSPDLQFTWPSKPAPYVSGPRVGVARAADLKWRFWLPGEPSVSAYKRSPRASPPSAVLD